MMGYALWIISCDCLFVRNKNLKKKKKIEFSILKENQEVDIGIAHKAKGEIRILLSQSLCHRQLMKWWWCVCVFPDSLI